MEDLKFQNLCVNGKFINQVMETSVSFTVEDDNPFVLNKLLKEANESLDGEATTMDCNLELLDNFARMTFTTKKWFTYLASKLYDSDYQAAEICARLSKDNSTIFDSRSNLSKDNLKNFEVVRLVFTDHQRLEEREAFKNQYGLGRNMNDQVTVKLDLEMIFIGVSTERVKELSMV